MQIEKLNCSSVPNHTVNIASFTFNVIAPTDVTYATVHKIPRKKTIKAPPRRKKKSAYLINTNFESQQISNLINKPLFKEQKIKKQNILPSGRNRWKSENIYLPISSRTEHSHFRNSDIYQPLLPKKASKLSFITIPKNTQDVSHGNYTKLEILKQYWQECKVEKECDSPIKLDEEEICGQESTFYRLNSPSKPECEQSSTYYSTSISSALSQNDISSYKSLYSEDIHDVDSKSENEKSLLSDDYYECQFTFDDISKEFDNLMIEINNYQQTSESVCDNDNKINDFNDLINILDVPIKSLETSTQDENVIIKIHDTNSHEDIEQNSNFNLNESVDEIFSVRNCSDGAETDMTLNVEFEPDFEETDSVVDEPISIMSELNLKDNMSWQTSELWNITGNENIDDNISLVSNDLNYEVPNHILDKSNRHQDKSMYCTDSKVQNNYNSVNSDKKLNVCQSKNSDFLIAPEPPARKHKVYKKIYAKQESACKVEDSDCNIQKNNEPEMISQPTDMHKNLMEVETWESNKFIEKQQKEVSLNVDMETWHLPKDNVDSPPLAYSVPAYNLTLQDLTTRSSIFEEDSRKCVNFSTECSVPKYSRMPIVNCPASRFDQFNFTAMPAFSSNMFQVPKSSGQFSKPFLVNLCIEGHQLHLGPFPFEVFLNMTLSMLKMKVSNELGIKTSLQRWILGNGFAVEDKATLLSYGIIPGSYIFLYVDTNLEKASHVPKPSGIATNSSRTKAEECSASISAKKNVVGMNSDTSRESSCSSSSVNLADKYSSCGKEPFQRSVKPRIISTDLLLSLKSKMKNRNVVQPESGKVKPKENSAVSFSITGKNTMNLKDSCNSALSAEINYSQSDCSARQPELRDVKPEENLASCPVNGDKNVSLNDSSNSSLLSLTEHNQSLQGVTSSQNDSTSVERDKKPCLTRDSKQPPILAAHVESNEQLMCDKDQYVVLQSQKSINNLMEDKKVGSTLNSEIGAISIPLHYIHVIPDESIVRVTEKDHKEENNLVETTKNYQRFLELESLPFVPNTDCFECLVCMCFVAENQGVVLRDCLHSFCKDCLANVVVYANEALVKCPYRDDIYSCNSSLQPREIKALVSAEVYEQYLQHSLKTAESIAENSFHCRSPDCPGWFVVEDKVNIFHCPVCSHYNCLTCQAIHEGFNCRQYQDNLKKQAMTDKDAEETLLLLAKMVREGQAMKCPKCCVVLMKKWGCDWLKCSVCQTEVCWVTKGPRWGPQGKGDTSAGCKCGVDGKKCHPSCTYCH